MCIINSTLLIYTIALPVIHILGISTLTNKVVIFPVPASR
jgi:hypothetical protein